MVASRLRDAPALVEPSDRGGGEVNLHGDSFREMTGSDTSRRRSSRERSPGSRPSAQEIFRDRIQRNPEVCSNCFRHIRDVVHPHDVAMSKRGDHTITKQSFVKYFVPKGERVVSARIAEESPARSPPNACRNCGSIRGSTVRPLPMERAVEYAWNLSRTLGAFDIVHSPLAIGFTVAHRKRFPEFGSRDDATFEAAILVALPDPRPDLEDVLLGTRDDPARTDDEPRRDRPRLPAPSR